MQIIGRETTATIKGRTIPVKIVAVKLLRNLALGESYNLKRVPYFVGDAALRQARPSGLHPSDLVRYRWEIITNLSGTPYARCWSVPTRTAPASCFKGVCEREPK